MLFRSERPDDMIRAIGLKAGDVVADVGCGTGFLARRIARIVGPTGKVYCQDIQPEMLELMKQRAAAEGVSGITAVLGTADDPKLPKGEATWVLLADVYHEFDDWRTMLRQLRTALAPLGKVALVEARAEDNSAGYINPQHRMSVRQVLAEWKASGYRLVELQESLPSHHVFILESTDAASQSAAGLVFVAKTKGVRRFRIELVREDASTTARIVEGYRALLDGTMSPRDRWTTLQADGHYGVVRGSLRVMQA